jgi:hypothetical protein
MQGVFERWCCIKQLESSFGPIKRNEEVLWRVEEERKILYKSRNDG